MQIRNFGLNKQWHHCKEWQIKVYDRINIFWDMAGFPITELYVIKGSGVAQLSLQLLMHVHNEIGQTRKRNWKANYLCVNSNTQIPLVKNLVELKKKQPTDRFKGGYTYTLLFCILRVSLWLGGGGGGNLGRFQPKFQDLCSTGKNTLCY